MRTTRPLTQPYSFPKSVALWRGAFLSALTIALVGLAAQAPADTIIWTNSAGDVFETAANWKDTTTGSPQVPTSVDWAQFTNNSTYAVSFTLSETTGSATFQAGRTILDIGAGNVWTLNNGIRLNPGATMIVASGSNVVNATGQLNYNTATMIVTNAGLSLGGGQEVHFQGNTSLIVSNGGYAHIANYQNDGNNNSFVVRGAGSVLDVSLSQYYGGSNFMVTVTDGATLTATSKFEVGKDHGSVIVSNGGQLITAPVGATYNYSGVLVTETGSVWQAAAGDFHLGDDGNHEAGHNAYVTVANGGLATMGTVYLGSSGGWSNSITVTDPGSSLTNNQMLVGGWGGSAVGSTNFVIVKRGGQLITLNRASVGDNAAAIGNQVLVTDTDSVWSVAGALYVGNGGSGNSVTISNGGALLSNGGNIGVGSGSAYSGSSNGVVVTGPGSVWNNSGGLYVGYSASGSANMQGGSNTLLIADGGKVIANGINIGWSDQNTGNYLADNSNSVVVTGVGSILTNNGWLTIGRAGNYNSLLISNGGVVYDTYGSLGYKDPGMYNSATVTGSGSVWSNTTGFMIGGDANGNEALSIVNSGQVVVGGSDLQFKGYNSTVTIAGTNSTLTTSGLGWVYGTGNSVIISNGGQFFVLGGNTKPVIGAGGGSNNKFVVTDPGSVWSNSIGGGEGLQLGNPGNNNSIVVSNQGKFYLGGGDIVVIGENNSANNAVLVTGSNSLFQVADGGRILIGWNYSGNSLTVSNGGVVVSAGGGTVGLYTGGGESALVTGNGSVWSNGNTVVVGGNGSITNTLTISAGGVVYDTAGTIGNQGQSASNRVLVTGAGSVWSNAGAVVVGNEGAYSRLTVSDGGNVQNSTATLGANAGSTSNSVTVTGQNSVWKTSGLVQVGGAANSSNVVSIQNGGKVQAGSMNIAAGNAVIANAGSLAVDGAMNNAGTLNFVNSVGTFGGKVVNSGAWISDPSPLTFSDTYSNGPGAYIQSSHDTYVFKKDFKNQTADNTDYDTTTTKFLFNGTSGMQTMQVAGVNFGAAGSAILGANTNALFLNGELFSTNSFRWDFALADPMWGFTNNFALGTLAISNTTLDVADSFASGTHTAGLYVASLDLENAGKLILSNNVQMYFMSTNGVTGLAFGDWSSNPGANVLLLTGAGFHEYSFVPEPSTMLLWLTGFATLWATRRRRRSGRAGGP